MQFTDEKAAEVKKWVVKRLEDISDADSDVLADYVLALLRSEAPDEEVKQISIANLDDFLKEKTVPFVNDIFATFFAPAISAPMPTLPSPTSFNPASGPPQSPYGPSTAPGGPYRRGFDGMNPSRKRSYNDGQDGNVQDSHYQRGDRSFKMPRGRQGGRGRGDYHNDRDGRGQVNNIPGLPPNPPGGFPGMPPVPPGFPFDPNDPMAAFLAMQAMAFPSLPGLPSPMGGPPDGRRDSGLSQPQRESIKQRCRDYDTKGFCVLGSTCPYEHGNDLIVAPGKADEYDPTDASIMMDIKKSTNGANGHSSPPISPRGSDRGRGRGRGRGDRGGFAQPRRNHAEFSHSGPNQDRSITTIVVEQIPEDKFTEEAVREFFSEFGNVVEVTMQAYKHLALVKYDNWASARAAWASPKVIFDNRFVKVYWYKPGVEIKKDPNGTTTTPSIFRSPLTAEEVPFDKEEFERQQAEAQKAHEDKMKKRKDFEAERQALAKQKEELLKKQQEEKTRLMEKLAAKTGVQNGLEGSGGLPGDVADDNGTTDVGGGKASMQTQKLRDQLAALEAEAKSLGIDPNAALEEPTFPSRGRGRGRGFYRGDRGGSYMSRGRGYDPSFRGSYRGRGAPRGRGGVLRLDNRSKKVAVSGVEFDAAKDEALRQYLVSIGEFDNIEPNPERTDSQIVSFKDRYLAEQLMFRTSDIPGVGKVEFSWVNTPLPPVQFSAKNDDDDSPMTGGDGDPSTGRKEVHHEVDYDVADDDDRWMID